MVQYSTVQYSTVQYSTVQYSIVQYSTVQYSTVQYKAQFAQDQVDLMRAQQFAQCLNARVRYIYTYIYI